MELPEERGAETERLSAADASGINYSLRPYVARLSPVKVCQGKRFKKVKANNPKGPKRMTPSTQSNRHGRNLYV